jgi:hypothetical protein
MATRAEQDATSSATAFPLGTIRFNTDTAMLSNNMGIELVAEGVQPLSATRSFNADSSLSELREVSSLQSLKGTIGPRRDQKYVIDWLANLDDGFIWPNMTDDETETRKTRTLRGGDNELVLRASHKSMGGSRNCAKLGVDGYDIFLCAAKPAKAKGVSKPGFILYNGAATEALQRSYLNANERVLKTKLVECEDWMRLKASVESAISELAAEDDVKNIMKNKLNDMNTLPASLVTERILESLQIELGEREKKAWKRRNVAAHGSDTEANQVVDLIRDLEILRIRFHRILLSITRASDFYYDYFSLGHPTRKLTEPIP